MPRYEQRKPYDYHVGRREVRGRFYLEDGLHRLRLCSWKEARIIDRDDDRNPIYRNKSDAAWSGRHVEGLYRKEKKDLENKEKVTAENKRSGDMIHKLLQEWIDGKTPVRAAGTVDYYIRACNAWMDHVGDMPIVGAQSRHFEKIAARLAEKGLSPYSVNNRLRTLKSFFRWAQENGEVDRIPKVEMLRIVTRRPEVPEEEHVKMQLDRIARLKAESENPRQAWYYGLHERAIMMWSFTGMRRSETNFLPWRHIDLEAGLVHVRTIPGVFKVKEGRDKEIFIPALLLTFLTGIREQHPKELWYLQAPPEEGHSPTLAYPDSHALTTAFARHKEALGIPKGIKPTHGFRALHATRLRKLGVDLDTIRGMLGHSDIRITAGYFGEPDELKRAAAEKYGEIFEGQFGTNSGHSTSRKRKLLK